MRLIWPSTPLVMFLAPLIRRKANSHPPFTTLYHL
jgi:hypothetical protein